MNRAWIPAGALAGVSVAGLIALGPLTDSLSSPVSFHPTLTVAAPTLPSKGAVRVSVDVGIVGSAETSAPASLSQGGRQAPAAPTSGEAGQVGFKRTPSAPTTAPVPPSVTQTPSVTPTPKPKPKRPASIGAASGPNGDNGLAGGGSGNSTNTGAQSGTPSATP